MALLKNFKVTYLDGTYVLTADIVKDSHIAAIEVHMLDREKERPITSIDPWQNSIEYRHSSGKSDLQFKLIPMVKKPDGQLSPHHQTEFLGAHNA